MGSPFASEAWRKSFPYSAEISRAVSAKDIRGMLTDQSFVIEDTGGKTVTLHCASQDELNALAMLAYLFTP